MELERKLINFAISVHNDNFILILFFEEFILSKQFNSFGKPLTFGPWIGRRMLPELLADEFSFDGVYDCRHSGHGIETCKRRHDPRLNLTVGLHGSVITS